MYTALLNEFDIQQLITKNTPVLMNYDYIVLQDSLKAFNASFHTLFCASAVLPSHSVKRESTLFFYALTKLDISLNTYPNRHLT